MTTNLLSLFAYQTRSGEIPSYLVLKTAAPFKERDVFTVSPNAMKLSPTCLIWDLQHTELYWQKCAQKESETPKTLIETQVLKIFGPEAIAILCDHPFQGLLLSKHLDSSGISGFFTSAALLTQRILKNVSWYVWFLTADTLFDFFQSHQLLMSECKAYPNAKHRLFKLIQRLQLSGPFDLSDAESSALQRRFSALIGRLWKWTFLKPPKKSESNLDFFQAANDLEGFPWHNFRPQHTPQVCKQLEYPLSSWAHLEPILYEQFEDLSSMEFFQGSVRLVEMCWSLTLFDLSVYNIKIPFRFPYAIQEDALTNFKTAMAQMSLAFVKFQKYAQTPEDNLEIDAPSPLIHWILRVETFINPREQNLEFSKDSETSADAPLCSQALRNLQNKLPAVIEVFQVNAKAIPYLDYENHTYGETLDDIPFTIPCKNLTPFFIYPDPHPLKKEDIREKRFLERTSAAWWHGSDSQDAFRDYFICEIQDRKLIWAFKNYRGDWFQHGIYS